jgi:hypothetical protein
MYPCHLYFRLYCFTFFHLIKFNFTEILYSSLAIPNVIYDVCEKIDMNFWLFFNFY